MPIFRDGRLHRVVGDVRPHDGRRRQGAGQPADRCAHDLRGRHLRAAGQDLQGRRAAARRAARSSCTTAACRTGTSPTSTRSSRRCARRRCAASRSRQRFGDDIFYSALDAMLERNKRAMRELIRRTVPEKKQYFEDYICDDGLRHGAVQDRLLDVARGRQVHLRFHRHRSAVDLLDQLPAERRDVQDVRGRLHDHGVRPADPVQRRVLRSDGRAHPAGHAAEAAEARGALVPHARARPHLRHPRRTAGPGQSGLHVRGRVLRQPALHVLGLRQATASGTSSTRSRSAAFRASRSATARTVIRCGRRSRTCRTSSSKATSRCASTRTRRSRTPAAPARFRGGNGLRIGYRFLEPGEISIHDDRWLTYPWGVNGGLPGERSKKTLVRADGTTELLPAKVDRIKVEAGDLLLSDTWGGGGCGDPFERDAALVAVRRGGGPGHALKARVATASWSTTTDSVDEAATERLLRKTHGERSRREEAVRSRLRHRSTS